jgi:hypothetical protein
MLSHPLVAGCGGTTIFPLLRSPFLPQTIIDLHSGSQKSLRNLSEVSHQPFDTEL